MRADRPAEQAAGGLCEVVLGRSAVGRGAGARHAPEGSVQARGGCVQLNQGLCEVNRGLGEESQGLWQCDRGRCQLNRGSCEQKKGCCEPSQGRCSRDKGCCQKNRRCCETNGGSVERNRGLRRWSEVPWRRAGGNRTDRSYGANGSRGLALATGRAGLLLGGGELEGEGAVVADGRGRVRTQRFPREGGQFGGTC